MKMSALVPVTLVAAAAVAFMQVSVGAADQRHLTFAEDVIDTQFYREFGMSAVDEDNREAQRPVVSSLCHQRESASRRSRRPRLLAAMAHEHEALRGVQFKVRRAD